MKFSESFIEGEYLKKCSKEEKQAYKLKSEDKKRDTLSRFVEENPDVMKDVNKNKKGCFGCLGVFFIIIISVVVFTSLFGNNDDNNDNSNEAKKETNTKKKTAADKNKSAPKKDKKPMTDKQKLASNIKKNIGKDHYRSIILNNDEDKIIIFLKNYDGVTKRGEIKSMDDGIVKSLKQLKKSNINVSNIEVTVMQDVQAQKLKNSEAVKLRTTWDPETVQNLNDDNEGDVFNHAKDYAQEYHLNKNIK